MDTVLSRVDKGNNKQLHDIVQEYSSGEISREPRTESPYLHVYICFKN